MSAKLIYYRHMQRIELSFDTVQEAAAVAFSGNESGGMYPFMILENDIEVWKNTDRNTWDNLEKLAGFENRDGE